MSEDPIRRSLRARVSWPAILNKRFLEQAENVATLVDFEMPNKSKNRSKGAPVGNSANKDGKHPANIGVKNNVPKDPTNKSIGENHKTSVVITNTSSSTSEANGDQDQPNSIATDNQVQNTAAPEDVYNKIQQSVTQAMMNFTLNAKPSDWNNQSNDSMTKDYRMQPVRSLDISSNSSYNNFLRNYGSKVGSNSFAHSEYHSITGNHGQYIHGQPPPNTSILYCTDPKFKDNYGQPSFGSPASIIAPQSAGIGFKNNQCQFVHGPPSTITSTQFFDTGFRGHDQHSLSGFSSEDVQESIKRAVKAVLEEKKNENAQRMGVFLEQMQPQVPYMPPRGRGQSGFRGNRGHRGWYHPYGRQF